MKKLSFIACTLVLVGAGCLSGSAIVEDTPTSVDEENKENIRVESPQSGDVVTSPITVSGEARVYENVVDWRIVSNDGDVLDQGFFAATPADIGMFGPFEGRVFLPVLESDDFVLELFTYSAMDGSVRDLVSLPLTAADTGTTSVEVYFIDAEIAAAEDCTAVDFEKRTTGATVNTAEMALLELLKGPTSDWAVTEIPDGTELNSIVIRDGVADVDFYSPNPARWSGGSCHTTAIRAQIEQTLLQFPTVDSVEISVNGDAHNILIP